MEKDTPVENKQQRAGSTITCSLIHWCLGVGVALLGLCGGGFFGAILGMLVGVLTAEVLSLKTRMGRLEEQAMQKVRHDPSATGAVFSPQPENETSPAPLPQQQNLGALPGETAGLASVEKSPVDRLVDSCRRTGIALKKSSTKFFTTGNPVVKTGVVVLFFGVAFLLEYVAVQITLPVEIRLAGAALGGLFLLALGWRLRLERGGYGLVVQGGGSGLLYLVIFAAAKQYALLPILPAFVLLTGLVALSCVLAVLQQSKSLAAFALVGGFLAPVLMSSGENNHLLLLSYYGLLNGGILGIAWFKAWRELNLVGFVFTFSFGTLWGGSGYQPEDFSSTEIFLLIFFIFYWTISVLYARRQPVNLRGLIDGPLVFGLPLVVSGLQFYLVRDIHYGMVFSALGFGLFYLSTASLLLFKGDESLHLLCEAFAALGIVFGSLAIPLALDGYLSAPAWALEGAGLLWVGVRQHRVAARYFGLLLQGAAAYIFLDSVWYPFVALPFANRYFFGCLFLAVASFFSSYWYDKSRVELTKWETFFSAPLMLWGVLWWYIGGLREVDTQLMQGDAINGIMLYVCASSILSALLARKLQWRRLEGALLLQLPGMVFLTLSSLFYLQVSSHLFYRWGIAAWALGFATQYRILYFYAGTWKKSLSDGYHLMTLWLLLFVLCLEVSWYIKNVVGGAKTWTLISWGLILAGALLLLMRLGKRRIWPVGKHPALYLGAGGMLPVMGLAGWIILACSVVGNPWPLPYIPLLNPLELTGLLVTATLFLWVSNRWESGGSRCLLPEKPALTVIALLFFFWINSVVGRAVHFYAGIPFSPASLYRSVIFQASLAAFWGTAALAFTVSGARRGSRPLWTVGALLLVMVVVKLFLVDLNNSGTLARVVSFLVVGIVMLVVGYFSPLPPRHEEHPQ